MEEIVNKVAQAGLISLDIKDFYPSGIRATIDLKSQLWQELVLREREFRTWVKDTDWTEFEGKHVGVWCSADAIVPTWAYMLVASNLEGLASSITFGDEKSLEAAVVQNHIQRFDLSKYKDQRVIIKGCSDISAAEVAFLELTKALKPLVKSLMFGEACSSVPVYKRR